MLEAKDRGERAVADQQDRAGGLRIQELRRLAPFQLEVVNDPQLACRSVTSGANGPLNVKDAPFHGRP